MTIEQAVNWLAGSVLVMLGFVVVVVGLVVINNILHKYWKPISLFTSDSFHPFGGQAPRYATEEELAQLKKDSK